MVFSSFVVVFTVGRPTPKVTEDCLLVTDCTVCVRHNGNVTVVCPYVRMYVSPKVPAVCPFINVFTVDGLHPKLWQLA